MATISASIQLYDRMSGPINGMISAVNSLCGAFSSVDGAMDRGLNTDAIHQARTAIDMVEQQYSEVSSEIEDARRRQEQLNNSVNNGRDAASSLANTIKNLVGAYAGIQGLKKLVSMSDEYTQISARLKMIADDQNTVESLQDKIYASAQRSRALYSATADMVSKLALRTGDLFTNDEAIKFSENLNKLYTIAGASQEEMKSSQLQLTQALGSGTLRGEEFNAVFEAAPNVMEQVARYMNVPIGSLREMAKEGEITGDIVKAALLSIPQEVEDDFNNMPLTWSQVWTDVMNRLYLASQPILEMISFLAQNWSILEPIILGVAGALAVYLAVTKGVALATKAWTAVQAAFNAVMALNPVFIVIMAIMILIGLIYGIVAAINKVTGSSISATGVIAGAIMAAVAFIWNLFLGLTDLVLGVVNFFVNIFGTFANFFANVFNDPVGSVIQLFGQLADSVLGVLESIAKAMDKLFGSNMAGAVQGWRSNLDTTIENATKKYGNGSYEKVMNELNLSSDTFGFERLKYTDMYNKGYDWGENLENNVSDKFGKGSAYDLDNINQVASNTSSIADNTGKIADSVDISNENLKYLRDAAEQEVVNRFTTAEVKVEMTNNNSVSSGIDIDGMVTQLANGVSDALEIVAEGVHA